MPESKRQIIASVLSRLGKEKGVRVVLKWETEEMENKPENVLLRKWLPQQDIIGIIK